MDKGIGFNRTITLKWLNAAANLRFQTDELAIMRQGLEITLLDEMKGIEARRKTIDELINIWLKNGSISPSLYQSALGLLPEVSEPQRVWLHYGLILIYYPYFRQSTAIIGQIARVRETFTRQMVRDRMIGEIGNIGSVHRTLDHLFASLLEWGILIQQNKNDIRLVIPPITIEQPRVQVWLLACALFSHPAEELPFADLINLPELFPFRFSVTLDDLRRDTQFVIQRQGGWEMVRLRV